jgi:hypothetical protein
MNSKASWKIRLAQILLGAGFILALVVVRGTHAGNEPIHMTTDWSHRRVVFSAPHNLGQHVHLLSNPRYVQQLVRRNSGKAGNGDPKGWRWHRAPEPTPGPSNPIHGDWSAYIGSGGTIGAHSLPAKFSFNENSASCDTNNSSPNTNQNEDFVVYNTGLVPSAAGTDASITGTVSAITATNGQTLTIINNNLPAPNVLTLYANTGGGGAVTATGTINSSGGRPSAGNTVTLAGVVYTFTASAFPTAGQVSRGASSSTAARNLRAAIDDNDSECAVSGCVGVGFTANPAVTHPATYNGTTLITLTASSDGAAGNFTLTKADGGNPIVVAGGNQGLGANDGLNFLNPASTTAALATNLAAAIARNGGNISPAIGVTSPVPGASIVTLNSTNSGVGGHPGNLDITVTSGVTGFAWTGGNGINLAGGSAGASIVAYDNVCPGGTGTVPWTYWSYNTGGQVVTSPVLSFDGSQVAFVQNVAGVGQLVLLKWAQWPGPPSSPPTIDAPITLTTQASAAAYTTCAAPCMYVMPFPAGGTITDSNSDPFYDFANDIIYVGDDGGNLRKFTGVFNGTPAQVSGGGWPVTLTNGGVLTSPVFDDISGKVFVASSAGYLSAVLTTNGTQTTSSHVAVSGFNDSPILDPTNENVYVITSNDVAGGNTAIFQFAGGFAGGTGGTETIISTTHPGTAIYDGDFDNAWYSGNAGHMYVCAPAAGSDAATLYQIAISNVGVLGAVTTGPALSTSGTFGCSGVTEFFNSSITNGGANPTGTDFIFLSVTDSAVTASPIACPAATGCLMSFDVTSGAALTTSEATVATAAVSGGTSGIVVDNEVSTATIGVGGGSQVYFTPLGYAYCTVSGTSGSSIGIGGCAIQASQSALQ